MMLLLAFSGCIKKEDTVIEQPSVELISPFPCDTLYFGDTFTFEVTVTDNTGLGNICMDMHNNFGHHDHGSHETCIMDPIKDAVNPFTDSWIFGLPEEKTEYTFTTQIELPEFDSDSGNFDTGDYHFHIYITDNVGYQTFTTLDVKVLENLNKKLIENVN